MGSATRESLDRAKAALAASPAVTLATGEQLFAAAAAIDGSAQLRAVLSDPATAEQDRAALVGRIFGSLEPTALALLTGVARSRWSAPAQLVDGVEELGIRAVARAAGQADVEAELFAFAHAVSSDAELELALGSKLGDPAKRVAIVDRLLGGKFSDATLVLVRHLVQSQRGRRIGELIAHIADVVADDSGALVAEVTVAIAPTQGQLEKLASVLTTRYGRAPRFNITIDPALVGGLRVQVGDEVVDGSIAGRLADLRLRLAG